MKLLISSLLLVILTGCGLAKGVYKDFAGYGRYMGDKIVGKDQGDYDPSLSQNSGASNPAQQIENITYSESDVDTSIPLGQKAGRYDVAVVIGNKTYGVGGTPDVVYAQRDASVMREYLVKTFGYDPGMIIYEEDATYAKFNEIFGNDRDARGKLFNFVKKDVSNVFIYYVGHGAPDIDSGDAYFIPSDADPQYLKTSGYRLQTFYDNLAKLPAKNITVVLDACFSGNSASGLLLKNVSSIALKSRKETIEPKQALIITSSTNEQVSTWYPEKSHSLFSYYFLKGLQGEADKNHDKKILVSELEEYLTEEVPYMAQRLKGTQQTPTTSGSKSRVLVQLQ